ncbi:NAD(P)/FAD-dependent oxidoreductase [Pleionea sediminis]|uniref:NAD(P)/FAD-dependent oxidoreductase n=1 Tax=Pleionea sediminis TaxID=2569479 RepID=UPI001185AF6D|nr:FAD-binding oxidoreductase [Pleionea sediminis]
MNYPDTYYSSTINTRPNTHSFESNSAFDVCIVGGGFAGLMTALSLVEKGVESIALIEQHQVGWGASGRNGGFVFGGYSLGPQSLVKQVGIEKARALYRETTLAVDLIRDRIKQHDIQCDVVDEGVLLANWFKDQKQLFELQSFMKNSMGVDWHYLSPKELRERIRSDRYHGGLFEPNAMHIHPLNYALGIAKILLSNNVKIFESVRVLKATTENNFHKLETCQGELKCEHLVIAGGGYLGKTFKNVSNSILPIATYVMTTEQIGSSINELMSTQAAIYDTRFAFDYYRPLKDTRILWGGRISASKVAPENLAEVLRQDMLKVFPDLSNIKVEYCWQGYMGYARHQMATIGQLSKNVWYANGFGGHGVAPTTAAGEILASAIAENDTRICEYQHWKLPWNGGPLGPLAAQMSYWWYQARDWVAEHAGG